MALLCWNVFSISKDDDDDKSYLSHKRLSAMSCVRYPCLPAPYTFIHTYIQVYEHKIVTKEKLMNNENHISSEISLSPSPSFLPIYYSFIFLCIHEWWKTFLFIPLYNPTATVKFTQKLHRRYFSFFLYFSIQTYERMNICIYVNELKTFFNHIAKKHFTEKTEEQLKRKSGTQTKVIADDINLGNNKAFALRYQNKKNSRKKLIKQWQPPSYCT